MKYRNYDLERVDRCPIDIYVASNMPYPYPYKLGKPANQTPKIRDSCTTWIQDSGIGDDTTNADVLDLAAEYDADFVIPCDELHDQPATTDAVHEFLELYDDSDVRATPLIPLQPPYDEHYRDLPDFPAYCLGGIAFDYSAREQINELQKFRRVAGDGPYAHALGIGGSMTVVNAIANDPDLVQSVDCSTPEQAAVNGSMIDAELRQKPISILHGEGSSRGRYSLAETNAYQLTDAYTKATRSTMDLQQYV
jgi:hypothetical protein